MKAFYIIIPIVIISSLIIIDGIYNLFFRKIKFRIIRMKLSEEGEKAYHPLRYRIEQQQVILFGLIRYWSTPTFAPPHLHQTYKEAYDYIKEERPNAIIQESLRDKCVRLYGEQFGELYDKSCRGEAIGNITQTRLFLQAVEKARNEVKL